MEAHVLLEGVKQLGNRDRLIISARMRVDNDMCVLRHNHVPHKTDVESLPKYAQSLDHDLFPAVVVQER